MNSLYHILPNGDATIPVEVIPAATLPARVSELSGRPGILVVPSIARSLRERGSVYIAANHDSEWRASGHRGGFVVRKSRQSS